MFLVLRRRTLFLGAGAGTSSANETFLGIRSVLAQGERRENHDRTREGVAAALKRGVKFGAANEKYQRNPDNINRRNRVFFI